LGGQESIGATQGGSRRRPGPRLTNSNSSRHRRLLRRLRLIASLALGLPPIAASALLAQPLPTSTPIWSGTPTDEILCFASADVDVDGDGDFDLVCGNDGPQAIRCAAGRGPNGVQASRVGGRHFALSLRPQCYEGVAALIRGPPRFALVRRIALPLAHNESACAPSGSVERRLPALELHPTPSKYSHFAVCFVRCRAVVPIEPVARSAGARVRSRDMRIHLGHCCRGMDDGQCSGRSTGRRCAGQRAMGTTKRQAAT
jgi:hypothetical protein